MNIAQAVPAIYVHTTNAAFTAMRAEGYASFLTPDQQARLEMIRQGRMLFDGKHYDYFVGEGRTQFNFPLVRCSSRFAGGGGDGGTGRTMGNGQICPPGMTQLYLRCNLLGLISLKSADLLFGQEPIIRATETYQQGAISDLIDRCKLHMLLYGCAVDCSYEGECFLEACMQGGQVYLQQIPADEIFPVGSLGPDMQYPSYVRYQLKNVGTAATAIWLLLTITYAVGKITTTLQQLGDDGKPYLNLSLDQWPLDPGMDPLRPVINTGIAQNTITWIPNLLVRKQRVNDYDGVIDKQDAINAKNSQVARVLVKHSDPKMAFPVDAFDQNGNIRSDYDAFPFREADSIPKYITWDGQLDAAMKDRAFFVNQLLIETETSPVLLGMKEGSAPDAYKKVRLESFNSLTKAQRKAAYWKAGIIRAVGVSLDLDHTRPGVRYDREPIGVELRDGIPVDDLDQAQTISLLISAHAMSRRRAVEMQLNDPAAVEKELGEIDKDVASATPSILMGSGPGGEPGEDPKSATAGDSSPAAGDNSDTSDDADASIGAEA